MKLKIAVPDNIIFKSLYSNFESVNNNYDFDLLIMPEEKVTEMMLNNRVDLALINPVGYGLGVIKADFRVIPGPALALDGFTAAASIFFRKGLTNINSIASPNPSDFMFRAAAILMSENYNISPEIQKISGSLDALLERADAAFMWQPSTIIDNALDISEEWSQAFDIALPLAFWVCREEEIPIELTSIVDDLADPLLLDEELVIDEPGSESDLAPRQGKIIWRWTKDLEESLAQTLQILYYHQLVPEIPAVKLIGFKNPADNNE